MGRAASDLPLDNSMLARRLAEIAELLEAQRANPFRVRAYRRAAEVVGSLDHPVHELLRDEGLAALTRLPGIAEPLARTIEQLVYTDGVALLDRLLGGQGSAEVVATVPGIGPELARRIHERLGIESLPELEAAAYDGRLARVPGLGRRRIQAVRESLAGRFRRRPRAPESARRPAPPSNPPVAELLDVDREYREKAARGELSCIAPRRFNPSGEAWLPVLHARRGRRHYTALFSNSALANQLGATRDWVVIYRDDPGGGPWTVVDARQGPLAGKRVVRGREEESARHHEQGAGAERATSASTPRSTPRAQDPSA